MRILNDNNTSTKRYLFHLLKQRGIDFTTCGLCKNKIDKPNLHHTKYNDATINDLLIVCRSCNNKKENKFLT